MSDSEESQAIQGFMAACHLFEAGCAIMEQNLRRRHVGLDEEAIQQLLSGWLLERPGAEAGDAPGRPIRLAEEA